MLSAEGRKITWKVDMRNRTAEANPKCGSSECMGRTGSEIEDIGSGDVARCTDGRQQESGAF